MRFHRQTFVLVAALLACPATLSTPASAHAFARFDPAGGDDRAAPEGVQPGLRQADGRACVKQCPDDRLPCDPPAFKTADGRCSNQWR